MFKRYGSSMHQTINFATVGCEVTFDVCNNVVAPPSEQVQQCVLFGGSWCIERRNNAQPEVPCAQILGEFAINMSGAGPAVFRMR